MERVVITGATGMIGAALTRACVEAGVRVVAVVRPGSVRLGRLPPSPLVQVVECALMELNRLPERMTGSADAFFHLGWGHTGPAKFDSILYQTENINATLHALTAAKQLGCGVFIGTGSQAEYGPLDLERIGPDSPCSPALAYGICKYAAGKLALLEGERLDLPVAWVRVFSVYGPNDKPTTMIASAVSRMLAGERVAFTPGQQLWDYLYCDDAARALFLLGQRGGGAGGVHCLGSGEARPLAEYIREIAEATGYRLPLQIGALPYAPNQVMRLCADISSLTRETGFVPAVSFEEGIRRTVAAARRNADG
ncbi:MAG: NAD(P)-dependent oxidoreductase [Christensenella sp.]|nr:NAD(P)-dependent oxidoreductase [Christensenella sp.]